MTSMIRWLRGRGYNVHQGTTYGKKEYDKRQRYTQPTPFGCQLDTNEMQSHKLSTKFNCREGNRYSVI